MTGETFDSCNPFHTLLTSPTPVNHLQDSPGAVLSPRGPFATATSFKIRAGRFPATKKHFITGQQRVKDWAIVIIAAPFIIY